MTTACAESVHWEYNVAHKVDRLFDGLTLVFSGQTNTGNLLTQTTQINVRSSKEHISTDKHRVIFPSANTGCLTSKLLVNIAEFPVG